MKRRPRILVEEGLTPVRELLKKEGYDVRSLGDLGEGIQEGLDSADALVISGGDANFMGMSDILSKAPVISANGRTPEEILASVRERVRS